MFLVRLYQHSKRWLVALLLFACGQTYIIYKWGWVVSPFYTFGMYAAPVTQLDTLSFFEIKVHGKPLSPFQYSAQYWDKINYTLEQYSKVQQNNEFEYTTAVRPFFTQYGYTPHPEHFLVQENKAAFWAWYKAYLHRFANIDTTDLKVYRVQALVQHGAKDGVLRTLSHTQYLPEWKNQ